MKGHKEDPVICRCEEIRKSEILEAVRLGAHDLEAVKRRTRAGMGLCQGQSCGRLVSRIISDETGIPLSEIPPMGRRQPVNPVSLGEMAAGAEGICVQIRYLNTLRSAAGVKQESLRMEEGSLVSDLLERLAAIHGQALEEKIFTADGRVNPLIRIARDEEHLVSGHGDPLAHGSRYDLFMATFGG